MSEKLWICEVSQGNHFNQKIIDCMKANDDETVIHKFLEKIDDKYDFSNYRQLDWFGNILNEKVNINIVYNSLQYDENTFNGKNYINWFVLKNSNGEELSISTKDENYFKESLELDNSEEYRNEQKEIIASFGFSLD